VIYPDSFLFNHSNPQSHFIGFIFIFNNVQFALIIGLINIGYSYFLWISLIFHFKVLWFILLERYPRKTISGFYLIFTKSLAAVKSCFAIFDLLI